MLRPRKMKYVELTVLKNDMDIVLEYLGKKASIQFPGSADTVESADVTRIRNVIERLTDAGHFIGLDGIDSGNIKDDDVLIPNKDDDELINKICSEIESLKDIEHKTVHEKQNIRETINEAKVFSKMNVPFTEFEHLSYLTIRIGRMDPKGITDLKKNLGERAVIIALDEDRFLAASSKKGRFALDTQLKKMSFEPVKIPENYRGVPSEMMKSLNNQHNYLEKEIERIKNEKEKLCASCKDEIKRLVSSMKTALVIEGVKSRFTTTQSMYHFSGWTPYDLVSGMKNDLTELTNGRVAVNSYSPEEVPSIKSGKEKVPVAMKHGAFVRGFESIIFSYGAPQYGTIDPTPIVAFFFTLMFGIMFGDAGQGFVLFFLGLLINIGKKTFKNFKKFSVPLISIGISSMIMGFLAGSVFTNEKLLVPVTMTVTSALFGEPMDRILHILPLASEGGSVTKLLYFFGFTIAIGVIINTLGILINIYNRCVFKNYEQAFFSKTGLTGLLLFWYALFIAIKILLGGEFENYDFFGLFIPLFFIFFGPVIWRIFSGRKPVFHNGIFAFAIEGFVELIETISTFFSNTVSFLRVGAFALAHAVFSFIVFYFTDELAHSGVSGTFSAALIMVTGNVIIIALEGLIVAIQVIRLQYYEFFNKFFIETGVEFAPFRFKNKE